jgi:hypothetical protein
MRSVERVNSECICSNIDVSSGDTSLTTLAAGVVATTAVDVGAALVSGLLTEVAVAAAAGVASLGELAVGDDTNDADDAAVVGVAN